MANVLWLVWDDVPFSRAQRNFLDLWDQLAHKVDFLHLVDGKADSRALQRQVLDADAVIMDDDAPLRMPGIVNALRTAVDGGTRTLVLGHEWAMNAHQHAEAVTFVEHSFGIRLGRERVHDLSAELSRLIAAQGPGQGFREAFLDGIDEVYLLQATRVRMNRDAFGLLTAPAPVLVTDRDTPVTVEPGEAVHVMDAWPVSDGAEPQVLVVGSAILPTTAPNDDLRKNLPFVERLIEWMTTRPPVPQLARNAALAVLDLELVIHDAVALVLSDQLGTEWLSQTLRPIQVKAAERWIEAGSPKDTPQSAFCDLGDLIDVIAKHWDIFQPLVSTDKRGRDKFRGDAEPILRARNRVARPIRARYAPLSAEDWDDIRRWGDRFASILSHTLRGRWEAEMRKRWRAEEGRVDEPGVEKRVAKATLQEWL